MRRWIIPFIILIVLAGSGYFFYTRWSAQQSAAALSNLQTSVAERGQLVATIGATGQVRSQQTTFMVWKSTGQVESVTVKVGDVVKAGQTLAELAQTSLPQNIILAQADLVNARQAREDLYTQTENAAVAALQAISNATEALKQTQYQLDNYTMPRELQGLETMEAVDLMQTQLEQARAAFDPYKYYSQSDPTRVDLKEALDQAQANFNAAVKRLDYEYSLQVAQSNLVKARKDYEKYAAGPTADDIAAADARIAAAQASLDMTSLQAPFDGVITLVDTLPGDQVSIGTQAFRLDDLSHLLVDLSVSEVDINQIKLGQAVSMTFDAIRNKEYQGTVTGVDRVGTLVQGAVDFIVTVELTEPDDDVHPGMTAAVNVVVTELEDVLLVPNRAVRFVEGQQTVYVLRDGQVVAVKVDLGASSETTSEVIGGDLLVGDAIVLNPPAMFNNDGPPPFARQR